MPKGKNERSKPDTTLVEIPVCCEIPEATWRLHIDVKLSPSQSNALRRVAMGLDAERATLSNGRRVVSTTDAIRYVLEQIDEQCAESAPG